MSIICIKYVDTSLKRDGISATFATMPRSLMVCLHKMMVRYIHKTRRLECGRQGSVIDFNARNDWNISVVGVGPELMSDIHVCVL